MRGLAVDFNIQRLARILTLILSGDAWRGVWDQLHLEVLTLQELGVARDAPDDAIWQLCQREQLILLTANRNDDGPRSLEAAIRANGTSASLPVFTAERVVERLLEYLMDIDNYRGTGRLYLP